MLLLLFPFFQHESRDICARDGFERECLYKYNHAVFDLFCDVFACLPLAAVINEEILVLHGGLSHLDFTLDDLNRVDRFHEIPPSGSLMEDVLWSDPASHPGRRPSPRGAGVSFGADVSSRFLLANRLRLVIRSHECMQKGYAMHHDDTVLTVFSASNYCGTVNNEGSFLIFERDLVPRIVPFCFFEHDGRILTNEGFLFLEQLEVRLHAGENITYACFDPTTQEVLYRPGKIVYGDEPEHVVEFTDPASESSWNETSDQYGSRRTLLHSKDAPHASHLSLRVTPNHRMYVQVGNQDTTGERHWQQQAGTEATPSLIPAHELASGFACDCAKHGATSTTTCMHGRDSVRMLARASGGLVPQDVVHLRDEQQDSPARCLQLTTKDELHAFIELYGFWLGNGSLSHSDDALNAVVLAATKDADYVRRLLLACGLVPGVDFTSAAHLFRITNRRWLDYFAAEYSPQSDASRGPRESGSSPTHEMATLEEWGAAQTTLHSSKWLSRWARHRLDKQQTRLLLKGIHAAAGASDESDEGDGMTRRILTTSTLLRDHLVQICIHAGYTVHFFHVDATDADATHNTWCVCYGSDERDAKPVLATTDIKFGDEARSQEHRYDRTRDGRTWCVEVDHSAHLIFAQRAQRDSAGLVTKASRPTIVGNCAKPKERLSRYRMRGGMENDIIAKLLQRIADNRLALTNWYRGVENVSSAGVRTVSRTQWADGLKAVLKLNIPFMEFQEYVFKHQASNATRRQDTAATLVTAGS